MANIGLATGQVFDALDVDGPDGAAALRAFATEHRLASTGPLVRTGSGGWHYYLAPTGLGNRDPRGLDHVDWRGRGGYVVAPPSRHASGQPYRFLRDLDHPLPEVPRVLRARLEPQRPAPISPALPTQPPRMGHQYGLTALAAECEQLAATPADSQRRNATLYLAGLRLHSLAAGGVLDPDDVTAHLLAAARRCGLGDREAARTIASAREIAIRHPRAVPDRNHPLASQPSPRSRARRQRAAGPERPAPAEADRER
jgi:Bifunctional DNA primase/polymerase, N-terminal